jgi:hypothetical protein
MRVQETVPDAEDEAVERVALGKSTLTDGGRP